MYIDTALGVGALAAGASIVQATKVDANRRQGVWLRKFFGAITMTGKTSGDGPIICGFNANLSAAEQAEAINADPQGAQDETESEHAARRYVPLIIFPIGFSSSPDSVHYFRGLKMPNWKIREGEVLNTFVHNLEANALAAGTIVEFQGVLTYRWLND